MSRISSDITKVKWLLCAICPYLTSLKSLWEIQKVGEHIWALNKMLHKRNWTETPPRSWAPVTPCHLLSFGMPPVRDTAVALLAVQASCRPTARMSGEVPLAPSAAAGCWRGCSGCPRQHRSSASRTLRFALLGERVGRNPLVPAWPQQSCPELGDALRQGTVFSDGCCKGAGN